MSPLVRKLSHGARLTAEDQLILQQAFSRTVRVEARQDLISEGQVPTHVHLVEEGFACRYKLLPNGTRQIVALLLPGDFCDLHVAILNQMDHAIGTLTACRVGVMDRDAVQALMTRTPAITVALWWATLVDEAILREWLVGMGRRPADQQMAHLLCELMVRLDVVGLVEENSCLLPLSQYDLGDLLGLTSVHVNRVLQQLRSDRLIRLENRRLTVLDMPGLIERAEFDPHYLHLQTGSQPRSAAGRPG